MLSSYSQPSSSLDYPLRHVGVAIPIAAPADRVWHLISEFHHWPDWGVTVRAVDSSPRSVEPGAAGRVKTTLGLWLPFEITNGDPGRVWEWRVAGIAATTHVIERDSDNACTLRFTVSPLFAPYLVVLWLGVRRVKRLAEPC